MTDSTGTANGTLLNGASVLDGRLVLDGVDEYVQFSTSIVPTSGSYCVAFFAQRDTRPATSPRSSRRGTPGGPGFYVGTRSSCRPCR